MFLVKGKTSVFVDDEAMEGVYVPPAAAGSAIEVTEDFTGFEFTREVIERNILTATVEADKPRNGLPDVTGSLGSELKAGSVEGGLPRLYRLWNSLLGNSLLSTEITSITGNTTTKVYFADGTPLPSVGATVVLKIPGDYHTSPVVEISDAIGDTFITLLLPYSMAIPDNTIVSASAVFLFSDNESSLSVTSYLGDEIAEKVAGAKVASAEISWETGALPAVTFAMNALTYLKEVEAPAFIPDFSMEPQPPVALDACAYVNLQEFDYNSFSLSITNTISKLLSACKAQGSVGSRKTDLTVTGSINPYMSDMDVNLFEKFNAGESFSFFIKIQNPSVTPGEYSNTVAIWMPTAVITGLTNGDQEGILTDEVEFQAHKNVGNDTIFISFI